MGDMYAWIEHTGELELRVEAPTEEGVFAEALAALGELLSDEFGGSTQSRRIAVGAPDHPALLVELLNELVFLSETEAFAAERAVELDLEPSRLRAVVEGRRGEPKSLVKAVTYHRLELVREGVGWWARVVLDV